MEKIKRSVKVINEEVLELIGGKELLLVNILGRKVYWIGHILKTNCHFHDAIEGQMTEGKVVERRRTQLLDYLSDRGVLRIKERRKRQFVT